jgi:hypothetical protein
MQILNLLLVAVLLLAGCSAPKDPVPLTAKQDLATAPVARQALPASPTPPLPPAASAGAPAATPGAMASVSLPAGAQYVCVADAGGTRTQTTIEFAPKVAELCRRHPEMGPCQYERNICRRSGGRVFAGNGVEITMQTEAEYDKKVMRVRFRAN